MVRSVTEEKFVKFSSSEGTDIGATKATGPEVYVATITTFISFIYDYSEDNLTHLKSLKLKSYPWGNVTDLCAAILVDADHVESSRDFKPEYLGYITLIFEDTSDS